MKTYHSPRPESLLTSHIVEIGLIATQKACSSRRMAHACEYLQVHVVASGREPPFSQPFAAVTGHKEHEAGDATDFD